MELVLFNGLNGLLGFIIDYTDFLLLFKSVFCDSIKLVPKSNID